MPSVYPLKSKKKLFQFLTEWYDDPTFADQGLKRAGVDNETFGRKSVIYLYLKRESDAIKLQDVLQRHGFVVDERYNQVNPKTVAVQVSYFKGHNWDE